MDITDIDIEVDVEPAPVSVTQGKYSLLDLVDYFRLPNIAAMARRLNRDTRDLQTMADRGLTHREADHIAVEVGLIPYIVWPDWLTDEDPTAVYDAHPATVNKYVGAKYRPGGLSRAILELGVMHLGEPISPTSIAKELGRSDSPTCVYVQMKRMEASGLLRLFSTKPRRYSVDSTADLDAMGGSDSYRLAPGECEDVPRPTKAERAAKRKAAKAARAAAASAALGDTLPIENLAQMTEGSVVSAGI